MNDLQHEADTKELQVEVRILKGLIDVVLGIISNFVDLLDGLDIDNRVF